MTAGQEEHEPLIGGNSKNDSSSSEYFLPNQPTSSGSPDSSTINISIDRKSYGTLNPRPTYENTLAYTWENIDIFGEISPGTVSVAKRIKSFFILRRKEPVVRKHLLKNVSGIALGGELLAILGSSGAGKTTLLNALAFRSPSGIQIASSAVRTLNGIPVNATDLRTRCAYVQQDDLFIGSLTAKEHLIFQAMLRMDRKVPYKQKLARVNEVISELSLIKCQNTIIGVPGRMKGLSGGERKRLSFASEALTDPPLLLCDEPTSGLDSFIAHNVLQVLKGLASKGKTVIITIHQPSSELFSLFDKLLLMAEGRVAFFGTPLQASAFFAQIGAPCPACYNPADHYIQVLGVAPDQERETRDRINRICDSFAIDKVANDTQELIKKFKSAAIETEIHENIKKYQADWCTQLYAILWRSWISVIKEPLLIKVRLIQTIMVALLIGVIFFQQKLDQDGVMNINGAIFLFLTNMTFQNVFAVIHVFCSELPIFLRESRSHLYRTDAFFLGKTFAELPLFLMVPFVFTAITYPMIGLLSGVDHFFNAVLIVALEANVATSFGYFISCISSSTSMALSVGPPVIIPFLLFGGFFLNSASVPSYFTWLSYLSWFRYGNEALLINQWSSVEEGEIVCAKSNSTCPSSGAIILETLNFHKEDFEFDIVALFGLIILFRLLAYFSLCLRSRSKE